MVGIVELLVVVVVSMMLQYEDFATQKGESSTVLTVDAACTEQ